MGSDPKSGLGDDALVCLDYVAVAAVRPPIGESFTEVVASARGGRWGSLFTGRWG